MCLIPGEAEKYRQAVQIAKMARMLSADGAVVTVSTGGHTYADQMLICQELEQNGIKTVLGVDEYCGEDGKGFPLVTYVPEAVAIVSTGNQESVLELPAVDRVLGGSEYLPGTTFDDGYRPAPADPIKIILRDLYVATCQNGFTGYRARAY
jgi:glycine reductase